ncbi:aminoglycoside 6'-N-acetyltransferase [Paenibacillus mesotrionivorans]|uniref:Aminoglycoside 6'-N-acetyltransferase n=1 Tax=Paenibacillus mesotrionivorans TaxID=3160968 RepID=A0ACC7NS41_9BACL
MEIVQADLSNLGLWVGLASRLFAGHSAGELETEYADFLATGKETGFLCMQDGQAVGFMNISVRQDYVNGTDSSPVAFLEAIYVLPEWRRRGVARQLIARAEQFARDKGLAQLASDCLQDNTLSQAFHHNSGFRETERVIYFVKDI